MIIIIIIMSLPVIFGHKCSQQLYVMCVFVSPLTSSFTSAKPLPAAGVAYRGVSRLKEIEQYLRELGVLGQVHKVRQATIHCRSTTSLYTQRERERVPSELVSRRWHFLPMFVRT